MLGSPVWVRSMPDLYGMGIGEPGRPDVIVYGGLDVYREELVVFVDRFEGVAFHSEPGLMTISKRAQSRSPKVPTPGLVTTLSLLGISPTRDHLVWRPAKEHGNPRFRIREPGHCSTRQRQPWYLRVPVLE